MKGKKTPPLRATLVTELLAQDTSRLNTQRFKSRLDFYMENESIHSYINFHRSRTGPCGSNQNTKVIGEKAAFQQPCKNLLTYYIKKINRH